MNDPASDPTNEDMTDDARTRGGWVPVGTAAERRTIHAKRGTERGRKRRRALIEAARTVFERVGYLEATIEDIVTEADVARGSFYTYFPDKLAIFRVVSSEVDLAIRASVSRKVDPEDAGERRAAQTVTQRLDRSNRRYIAAYREHAVIYGLVEQVATIDPAIHEQRLGSRRAHVARVAESIERWQAAGRCDPTVDADVTAAMLVSMSSNFCYWWFVGGEEWDEEEAAAGLTANWVRMLGLRDRPKRSWVDQQE